MPMVVYELPQAAKPRQDKNECAEKLSEYLQEDNIMCNKHKYTRGAFMAMP